MAPQPRRRPYSFCKPMSCATVCWRSCAALLVRPRPLSLQRKDMITKHQFTLHLRPRPAFTVCALLVWVTLSPRVGHGVGSGPFFEGLVECRWDAAHPLTTKGYDHKTPIRTSFDQRFNRCSQLLFPFERLLERR